MDYELLRKNFERHGFITSSFKTKEEAAEYLDEILCGKTIGFGGSVTLKEMGLYDKLSRKNVVVWHHILMGNEIKELASHAKIYISSVNSASQTGELVNIDGAGNRIAMTLFGPEKVYYVIGRNKITEDLPAALHRAKNVAAPKNAQRLKANTPCAAKADRCYDCESPERICNCTIIIDRAPNCTPSEIIFVDEVLGF